MNNNNTNVVTKGKETTPVVREDVPRGNFETAETVSRRASVKLSNVKGSSQSKRTSANSQMVWFDSIQLTRQQPDDSMFIRMINSIYSGVVVYLDNIANLLPAIPKRLQIVLKLRDVTELVAFKESVHFADFKKSDSQTRTVAFHDATALRELSEAGVSTCYASFVDDRESAVERYK